jgi:hypothetical protein
MSFFLAHSWRAFVLTKGDRHGANKNEIATFVSSITAKDFSHSVLLERSFGLRLGRVGRETKVRLPFLARLMELSAVRRIVPRVNSNSRVINVSV